MTTSGPGSPTLKSPPREPSHICSRCSLLTFKEEFVERSPKLALDLDELLASRPGRMGWCRVGPIISKGEFDVLATTAYFLSDTLPTLPTLRDSSFKCDFCKKLRDALLVQYTHLLRGVREGPDSKIDQERHGLDPSLLIIRAYYSWFRWSCTRLAVQLRVTIFKQLGHSELGLFREPFFMTWVAEAAKDNQPVAAYLRLPERFGDPQSLSRIKDMLPKEDNHTLVDPRFVPKRLLDVRAEPARLVSGERVFASSDQVPQYAALSYCWGPPEIASQQHTLTQDTLAYRLQKVEVEKLPLTVRDAVRVTRALALPYLWVDALCILQDDTADWEQQCGDMHKVYGNAHITLCAASSKSCVDGLMESHQYQASIPFRSTNNEVAGYFSLRLDIAGTEVMIEKHKNPLHGFGGLRWFGHVWPNRGWVFQERVSSRRKLLFWRDHLQFACPPSTDVPQGYCTISGDMLSLDAVGGPIMQQQLAREASFHVERPNDQSSRVELLNLWLYLIQKYGEMSTDSFTNPLDVLPAISGLAAVYHRYLAKSSSSQASSIRLNPEYIAGYWQQDLTRSLLWQIRSCSHGVTIDSAAMAHPRARLQSLLNRLRGLSQQQRIPSWSQLTRGKTWNIFCSSPPDYWNLQPAASILNARTKPLGESPFGYIQRHPHLLLRTRVVEVAVLAASLTICSVRLDRSLRSSFQLLVRGDRQAVCLVNVDFASPIFDPEVGDRFGVMREYEEGVLEMLLRSSCCLGLLGYCDVGGTEVDGRRPVGEGDEPVLHKPTGLVLHPVPGGGGSSGFYRVGVFTPNVVGSNELLVELFETVAEEREICLY
ncbi:Putative protein of unknown function [Podospora comata]|uniref:Heterokaryon incompatibility domain-containing protein n=1 Tax=Podospora comata TaxID=48703 RepID=A0ABY6S784_PODCO|nr:Putative protein of unknown function [Podospora comata]